MANCAEASDPATPSIFRLAPPYLPSSLKDGRGISGDWTDSPLTEMRPSDSTFSF